MRQRDIESLKKEIFSYAKTLRSYRQGGQSVTVKNAFRRIQKTYRLISAKVKKNEPVSEAEKWVYENFHSVYTKIFSKRFDFSALPYVHDEPRILLFARFLVENSLNELSRERIKGCMNSLNGVLSWTYEEIVHFDEAMLFAVLEHIAVLCDRLQYIEYYRKQGNGGVFIKEDIEKDVYLYFLLQSEKTTAEVKTYLYKQGYREKTISINYHTVLLNNAETAKTLFTAICEQEGFFTVWDGIKNSDAYQVISQDYNLENVSYDTLKTYFSCIERIAKKCDVSERYVAERLAEEAKRENTDPSVLLFDDEKALRKAILRGKPIQRKEKKNTAEKIYIAVLLVLTAGLDAALGYFVGLLYAGLSLVPIFFFVEKVINEILSYRNKKKESPKMAYDSVPDEYAVTVVFSVFCAGVEQFREYLFQARSLLAVNGEKNVKVALLVDTKTSKTAVSDLDKSILTYCESVKTDEDVCVFLRKKTYKNEKFAPHERKRGAICDLVKCFHTHDTSSFYYISQKDFITTEYLYLLDADTKILPGGVLESVNRFAHPYNKKYDLLACYNRSNLYSVETLYSERFSEQCGFEGYPFYTGLYYSLFGKEIFCGKGMVKVSSFYKKIVDIFPEEKILSHDILEGSVLTTGTGETVFEDVPNGFLSDRERKKRWNRGDIQLLPFLCGRWQNEKGERVKKDIAPLYKFVMLKNVARLVYAPTIFALFICGLFLQPVYGYVGLCLFSLPYFCDVLSAVRKVRENVLPFYIVQKVVRYGFAAIEDFFMIPYYAVSDVVVLGSTLLRMILGKNLLEWKTFRSSQNEQSILGYVQEFLPSVFVLTVVLLVCVLFTPYAFLVFLYTVGAILVYLEIYFASSTEKNLRNIGKDDKRFLQEIALATYRYFDYMRKEKGLISDALQVIPFKGQSKTVSPTDIGFSLLAEICGQKLGFISEEICRENVLKTLKDIIALPKWYGNLYNWYFVNDFEKAQNFVSAVDEGNFLLCLVLVQEFFRGKDREIPKIIQNLLDKTDLSKLYDKQKHLFYVGYDGKKMGHYDLLASESRILSYLYIAFQKEYRNYYTLKREYSSQGKNFLLSWNGTMFEMLLPELFLPAPNHSVLSESVRQNIKNQKKNKINGRWGVSESGYYAFDENGVYQYKAFGVSENALSSEYTGKVIAPYASVLALDGEGESCHENLRKMQKYFTEYGFYESIDCSEKEKGVYQYLTHHQGMILCAVTNALEGDFLKNLAWKNKFLYGLQPLLNELPSTVKHYAKKGYSGKKVLPEKREKEGRYTVFSDKNDFAVIGKESFFLRFGETVVCKEDAYFFSDKKREDCSLRMLPSFRGVVFRCCPSRIEKLSFYADIVLNDLDAYFSHPTFSDMFLTVKKIDTNTVLFSRKYKKQTRHLLVRVKGMSKVVWDCNRSNRPDEKKEFPAVGTVLTPCIRFSGKPYPEKNCEVTFLFTESEQEACYYASVLPESVFSYALEDNRQSLRAKTEEILPYLLYGEYDTDALKKFVDTQKQDDFFEYVRYKKVLVYKPSRWNAEECTELCKTVNELYALRFSVKLVFWGDFTPEQEGFIREQARQNHLVDVFVERENVYSGHLVLGDRLSVVRSFLTKKEILPNEEESVISLDSPLVAFRTGCGGFVEEGYLCDEKPLLPYAHVVAERFGGFVHTVQGGGFFYFGNSRENPCCLFHNDSACDHDGENIYIEVNGSSFYLSGGTGKNHYSLLEKGCFTHTLQAENIRCKTKYFLQKEGRIRLISVDISDFEGIPFILHYRLFPKEKGEYVYCRTVEDCIVVEDVFARKKYYLRCLVSTGNLQVKGRKNVNITIENDASTEILFCFSEDMTLLKTIRTEDKELLYESAMQKQKDWEKIQVSCPERSFEEIANMLFYQTLHSRLFGRTGYYQVGGAYGFRDQLQDCMNLFDHPELLKEQIVRCCRHTYREGDVMHWWHEPFFGIRTRIGDDKLFLVWAVCRYVELTGDRDFLKTETEYLRSEPLRNEERDRCENPPLTDFYESVEKHCERILKNALKYGRHRLLVMGTGDWNDGMDEIGEKGEGESVFTSMLAYKVLVEFAQICEESKKKDLLVKANELKVSLNLFAFDKDRYLRLCSDEGVWIGKEGGEGVQLDLLTQAFAVLSGVAEGERAVKVLKTCEKTVDRKGGLIKLLTPSASDYRLGYISDYPEGIRENGGQYTHAAVWYLTALCKIGEQDKAYEYFQLINPAEKCRDADKNRMYKGEPYVLAGDVYSNKLQYGRCGWSWYTGSAGWAYRLIFEEFFGIKIRNGKLQIQPKLPRKLNDSVVSLRFGKGEFMIRYRLGVLDRLTQDGVEVTEIDTEKGGISEILVEIPSIY